MASRINWRILYEIPLACLSFLFYKSVRWLLRLLVRLASRTRKEGFASWRVLDGAGLRKPLALPVTMTTGPRWNPHALIASAGPFAVERGVSFQLAPVQAAAEQWTVVIHRLSDHQAMARLSSLDGPFPVAWPEISLPPGVYVLGLRYYQWRESPELPAVRVDGRELIARLALAEPPNSFYAMLPQQAGLLYLCMHYYIFVLLRYRDRLSQAFVARELLPVGNPETEFEYGLLEKGVSVQIEVSEALLTTHAVYFTAYNKRSFPEFWYRIERGKLNSPVAARDGYYLLRLHRRLPVVAGAESPAAAKSGDIAIVLQPA